MKAKFIYETIGDVLKPKSEDEIMSLIDNLDSNELLVKSVEKGFLPGVKRALERGAYIEFFKKNVHAGEGYALRSASYNGYYDIVAVLLDNGADVHRLNDASLQYASEKGYYDIVEILVKYGADVHANDSLALRFASEYGHHNIVKLLKKSM